MNDNKIHDLIEQGNAERKQESWEQIEGNLYFDGEEEPRHNGGGTLAVVRSKKFIACACAVFAVLVALILFFALYEHDDGNDELRFYSSDEYSATFTSVTLKEYAEQNGLDILYFDWYESGYFFDAVFTLKDSDEILCYREEIYDDELYNIIVLFVVEEDTELDFFEVIELVCSTAYESSSGVTVMWGGDSSCVYAHFEYNGFKYYLQIDDIEGGTESILHYAELLLG